jgi:ribosomal protein L35AE/L33A
MRRFYTYYGFLFIALLTLASASSVNAQARETYTGTILSYGTGLNTRTVTSTFTLTIEGRTSDQQAQEYLGILQSEGQTDALRAIRRQELGRFSVGSNVGIPVNVVRETVADGRRRIFIVFERWTQFAEYRGGYRSLDYPFGVIEINLDESTGKGEGTYIAAAQIRWRQNKRTNQNEVEIENFATFPARLLGVQRRGARR